MPLLKVLIQWLMSRERLWERPITHCVQCGTSDEGKLAGGYFRAMCGNGKNDDF